MSRERKPRRVRSGTRLAGITGLLLLGPLLTAAAAPPMDGPPDGGPARDHHGPQGQGPGDHGPWEQGPWERGPGDHGPWGGRSGGRWHGGPDSPWRLHPRFLEGLRLTEDQQDRIFAIEHAAAPALREQAKALRKAHEGLRNLGTSPGYDEARAKALTDAAARAVGQLLLLRIRGEHEIYAVLTPEQQTEVTKRRQRWEGGDGDHERGPHG